MNRRALLLSRLIAIFIFLLSIVPAAGLTAADDDVQLAGLADDVEVYFDGHGIPHVFARGWTDAAQVLGYLHARDRLWQMDMFRRQASGTTAEIVGRDGLESDILMRQLGIRRTCETLWNSGDLPEKLRNELVAYAKGVNARIAAASEAELSPYFQALGYRPAPWTPVDSLVFSKYMGWDQSGTFDDLWFGTMVEKLGVAAVEELWPVERPYEVPTVKYQKNRDRLASDLRPLPGMANVYERTLSQLSRAGWLGRGGSFGSNNWAVDGTKTASGKPILCNDPHLGFSLPAIWYACHVSVNGQSVAGVTFAGGPTVVIGHNDRIAWGITNMQSDAVDFYVETVDPADPLRYKHRGEWKKMERITEHVPVRGQEPHELNIDSTVHGPIVRRDERAVSLAWTGLVPTKDVAALWGVSRARDLAQFLSALDNLAVPCLNMVYADVDGNIAIHPCGTLPVRTPGQGRIPMDGASGEDDWAGTIPRGQLPLSVNPPDHFVASANGRPAPLDYPHYLGWMWDCNYRIRRINDMLSKAEQLTVDSMKPIQLDHYDKAAERFVPTLVAAMRDVKLDDAVETRALAELSKWDYVADTDSLGTAIWLRWFESYRDAVWVDEWTSRGIKQPSGSWGFSGANRREPEIELLEYITREDPNSKWFDDRTTPRRESRDDVIRGSFTAAVASLRKQFGDDVEKWSWGKINVLSVNSLSRQPDLARTGGPTVGTEFTVNPGSNVGTVGGGASWRMIVDLANTGKTAGMYPGGQSEHPASPLYGDLLESWAKGEYLSMAAVGTPERLPDSARAKKMVFRGG
ncbi:MAG: penicillin acylase family protein [Planctomycetia bacterium]|nr:penicillin acylase family protein [Planctomycetia bacterium]